MKIPNLTPTATLLLLFAIGCGGAETAPVQGVVTLDGQPVYPARVTFSPKTAEGATDAGGRVSTALTEVDGSYSIAEAAIGDNIVGVMMLPVDEDSEDSEDNEIPTAAGKPDKDSYTVASGENKIDIKLAAAAAPTARAVADDDDDD